jgi:ferritin-like metal-binding protein YciE
MTHHLNDKFVFYLNIALAAENSALERLQSRIQQTILEDAKQQLQHHLEETIEQQDRLRQIITKLGGTPTQEKAKLPISSPPESIAKTMENTMMTSAAERELKESIQDTIIENAEVTGYTMLIQMAIKQNIGDAISLLLRQNLQEEEKKCLDGLEQMHLLYIYKTVVQTELLLNHLKKITPIIYNNN